MRSTPMKKSLFSATIALAIGIGLIGIVPPAAAAPGDSLVFSMVRSAGAKSCLDVSARGRVTLSDLGIESEALGGFLRNSPRS